MFLRQILRRWHCHSSSPLLRLLFPFTFTCSRTGLAIFFQSHLPNQLQNICVLYLSEKTDVKTESCWTLLRDFWRFCTLQHCEESTLRHPSQGRRSSRPSAWRSPGCRSASFIWDPKRKLIYHWMLSSFLMAPKLTWHHIYQIIADFFLGSSYRRMCIVCIMVSLVSSWSIAMNFRDHFYRHIIIWWSKCLRTSSSWWSTSISTLPAQQPWWGFARRHPSSRDNRCWSLDGPKVWWLAWDWEWWLVVGVGQVSLFSR